MKCDELTQFNIRYEENGELHFAMLYNKKQVDEAIAELKARIAELDKENAELRFKNEGMLYALADAETDIAMATKWRKCSDEMPEDDTEILATDGDEIWLCYKTTMCDGSPWFQPSGLPHIEGITHWMPLPKAPEESNK